MTPAEVRKLFPRRREVLEPTDGFCLGCDRPMMNLGGWCPGCLELRELDKARAEVVGRFLGVPNCTACGSVWLHGEERGAPVVDFVFCVTCGKIQPQARR